MEQILEIKNLVTHFFIEEGEIHAVNGVSLTINKGEMLALVGESGSGKSVSLLSVMGLVPTPPGEILGGQVLFQEKDLLQITRKEISKIRGKDIAMIFQDPMTSLNPVIRVGKQIEESLKLHLDYSNAEAEKRIIELLELVGIPDPERCAKEYPHQFSGGMRQRIMIAIALACNPKVLIADEPTTALDVTIQAQIASLIKNLQQEIGMSVIWITHDLGLVASLADRVAVMYAGKIVEQGDVDDIFDNSRHPYTKGLLKSLPKMDEEVPELLAEIQGSPPDCINPSEGCAFALRCEYAQGCCFVNTPELEQTDIANTLSACFVWKDLV